MSHETPQARIFYIDVIRSYAIFLVVISHVFAPICWSFNDYPLKTWWVFNVCDSIIRLCVPLFVMISGKLLLNPKYDESVGVFFKKRLGKIIPSFIFWSFIYNFYLNWTPGDSYSPLKTIQDMLQGPVTTHLWFVYMILGLYLITPPLRIFIRNAKPAEIVYALILWAVFLCTQFFIDTNASSGPLVMVVGYVGYFVLGYYLDRFTLSKRGKDIALLVSILIVAFNALGTYIMVLKNSGNMDEYFLEYLSPIVAVYAASFYLILKSISYDTLLNRMPRVKGFLVNFSLDSYNVYLVHAMIIWALSEGKLGFTLSINTIHPFIGVPLLSMAVFAGSLGLVFILKKIPVLNRIAVS